MTTIKTFFAITRPLKGTQFPVNMLQVRASNRQEALRKVRESDRRECRSLGSTHQNRAIVTCMAV